MNQHALLQCIRRHVRESITDDGTARPLGEVVGHVFAEINTLSPPTSEAPGVIPMSLVAAFVDGTLSTAEAETVCQAAQQNRSVVAELVAAVRGQHEAKEFSSPLSSKPLSPELPASPEPPLSRELSEQLLEMGKSLSPASAPSSAISSDTSRASTPPVTTPATSPPSPTAIQVTPVATKSATQVHLKLIGAVTAIAAAVMLLVYWQSRPSTIPSPTPQEVVEAPSPVPRDQNPVVPDRIDPSQIDPTPETLNFPRIVEMPPPEVSPTQALPTQAFPIQAPKESPNHRDQRAGPTFAAEDIPKAVDRTRDDGMFPPESVSPSRSEPSPAAFVGLKWKRIHGILAAEQAISLQSEGSAARTSVRWNRVREDTISFNDVSGIRDVSLRTLAFSRAEAELASGGRLVMRGESAADLTATTDASVELDLRHGGVAMIDFPVDTVVNLRSQNRAIGRIHWNQPRSTVLAEYGRAGLMIHVEGNGITIDDRELDQPTIIVGDNRNLRPAPALIRLPAWVDRNVDAIEIPRTVLAQIGGTNDLMQNISDRIRDLAAKPALSNQERKTLAVLARWQVTLGEVNLFRLLSNKFAIVRLIALERLVDLPEWEPRYDLVWGPMRRNSNDQRQATRMERLCKMVRSSQQPTKQQIDQMITGLDSPALATRAMYDYLLRRMFGGGPDFDPSVTAPRRRALAISQWRDFAALRQQ